LDADILLLSNSLGEGRELGIETKLCELGDEALDQGEDRPLC
jgi:hypothetical protein